MSASTYRPRMSSRIPPQLHRACPGQVRRQPLVETVTTVQEADDIVLDGADHSRLPYTVGLLEGPSLSQILDPRVERVNLHHHPRQAFMSASRTFAGLFSVFRAELAMAQGICIGRALATS